MSNIINKKVGITYNPTIPLFYSGANQTSLLLAELFTELKYDVTFVNTKISDDDWWSDYPLLENITLSKLYQTRDLDLLIDIDGLANEEHRKKAANKVIVFMRSFMQFTEMDNSVYPEKPYQPRSFKGVDEIWCWDIMNPPDTIPSIQTLFPCPIICVPFIWSPTIVLHYLENKTIHKYNQNNNNWTVHIAEKNRDNTSSSIIPLVAIKELINNKSLKNMKYKCHNMERLKENRFLKENVLHNIESDKLPLEFVEKEPFYKWLDTENNIQLSHTRFIPLRVSLLNTLWLGIPLIHNSPILKELHPVLADLFYYGNEFKGIINAFKYFIENNETYYSSTESIRNAITNKWSIQQNLGKWSNIISTFFNKTLCITTANNINNHTNKATSQKKCIIAFADWWPGFNYNSNFYLNALRHYYSTIVFEGIQYTIDSKPNLVLFGPYSQNWKQIPNDIPKVFVSAENWNIPTDDSISFFLTSSRNEDEKHMRLPTWMTFIDWFSGSTTIPTDSQDNPILMPLHYATTSHSKAFKNRQEFCAFVVSNPICKERNEAFKAVNDYKRVHSGGALFNNIGGQLALKYPGGGSGDLSKHHFFSNHKFTISFENSQASGYITEKVLHSKMAGCIPIYWGDKDTDTDFTSNSFINLSNIGDKPEKIVEIIKMLESNPDMCEKIANTPILDKTKKQKALNIISNMCDKLVGLANIKRDSDMNLKRISKTFIINLDTRRDRWDNLIKAEPYLEKNALRIPGVNGKNLQMNQFIYNLFENNQFQWKKSVIGCNLSHIQTWSQILKEKQGDLFLILEDDVRFNKDWIEIWNNSADHIPEDAELLYLGGVLPPNKPALPLCSEQVNKYWNKIKPNTLFSPIPLPIFHFCAYSYILTRKGAQKIIDYLTNSIKKSFTVSDHLLGSPDVGLKKYFINPQVSYCFQEDDPVYVNSEFNNLHRKDTFDSDIWNNTECFSQDELHQFINITLNTNKFTQVNKKILDIYFIGDKDSTYDCYEKQWLEEIYAVPIDFKPLVNWSVDILDNTWFLVQRPHLEAYNKYFKILNTMNKPFKVIHLSDEFGVDNTSFYSLPLCKAVVRNYVSKKCNNLLNVITIPLGYHHKPSQKTQKSFSERKLVWSFHGTAWFDRKKTLEKLTDVLPHNCHLTPDWNHHTMTKEEHYLSTLQDSKFCPVLRGNNVETFRLYECLEAGTIPLYVRQDGDEEFWKFISNIGLRELTDWEKAKDIMIECIENEEEAERYRKYILEKWSTWKALFRKKCAKT
jgi:GR25 family glycosyltransferase involved in LPS biosynthesis